MTATAPRKVGALPGSGRPDDALARLREVLTDDEDAIVGVLLGTVNADGSVDFGLYGKFRRNEFAQAGALLLDYSVNGDFEAA